MSNTQTKTTKTKKNIPELRFPGFEGEWVERTLSEILNFKNGINADKDSYGKGIKFINVLDILNTSYITYDNIVGLIDVDETTRVKYDVSYGDILFQRSSETRNEVGTANVYLDNEKSCTFGGFVIRGKKIGRYNPFFMKILLSTSFVRKEITSWSGGSTRYNVGQEILKRIKYVSPKENEQNKIASFLSTVDTKINLLTKKKELMEQYKKGITQKIFSQEIRFKDDDGKDYPNWEEKRLGEVCHNIGDGLHSTPEYIDKSEIHFINGNNLINNKIVINQSTKCVSINEFRKHKIALGKYTILLSINGTIGNCAFYNNENIILGKSAAYLSFCDKSSMIFISYYLGTQFIASFFNSQISGSTIKNLSLTTLRLTPILLPFSNERIKIGTFLTTIDTKLSLIDDELNSAQKFKKGLLQKMFI